MPKRENNEIRPTGDEIIEDNPIMKNPEKKQIKYQYFPSFNHVNKNTIKKDKNLYIINDLFNYKDC